VLTLWLARFEKRNVLAGLMVMFIAANLVSALSTSYSVLLVSRVLAGLVQGPFYGIGAVVATRLVAENLAGRAVGQMFAGLTLANVLGVPFGAWIGNIFGWNVTFYVVSALGAVALVAIMLTIQRQPPEPGKSVRQQLAVFRPALSERNARGLPGCRRIHRSVYSRSDAGTGQSGTRCHRGLPHRQIRLP